MTYFVELGDYCEIAAELLGTNAEHPTLIEKAAVLVEHLARNHPLPDGNKRAAFLSVWLFLEVNGRPFAGEDADADVPMVEKIATGEATPQRNHWQWSS